MSIINNRIIFPEKEFTSELSALWLHNMHSNNLQFYEPHLNFLTAEKMKLLNDHFKQNHYVFLTAIDLVERYLYIQDKKNQKINNPFIIMLICIYIAGKLTGDIGDLNLKTLQDLYKIVIKETLPIARFKETEIQILNVIGFELPLITQLDDMEMLLHLFVDPMNLKCSIRALASSVLCFSILHRRYLFKRLCHNYAHTDELSKLFKPLYVNRFYWPFAVIICTFNIIELPTGVIQIDKLSKQFGQIANIPYEHLDNFAALIYELWLERKNVNLL